MVKIVQVIHVVNQDALDLAREAAATADTLLLDSGNPAARELGGTGRIHDWELSRRIVAQSPIPVFLAGGLRVDNIREAIEAVQPFGVDLCSSVRTEGVLDEQKLRHFLAAVHT